MVDSRQLPRTFEEIEVEQTLKVVIFIGSDAPANLFSRMTEEPDVYNQCHGPMNRDEVLEHWSYNAAVNGVYDAIQLDGWADLMPGIVKFQIQ